jgi:hypothetical protein
MNPHPQKNFAVARVFRRGVFLRSQQKILASEEASYSRLTWKRKAFHFPIDGEERASGSKDGAVAW